ncbi:MAG: hypothetical protein ACPGUD_04935 [Parashewanella sp.]
MSGSLTLVIPSQQACSVKLDADRLNYAINGDFQRLTKLGFFANLFDMIFQRGAKKQALNALADLLRETNSIQDRIDHPLDEVPTLHNASVNFEYSCPSTTAVAVDNSNPLYSSVTESAMSQPTYKKVVENEGADEPFLFSEHYRKPMLRELQPNDIQVNLKTLALFNRLKELASDEYRDQFKLTLNPDNHQIEFRIQDIIITQMNFVDFIGAIEIDGQSLLTHLRAIALEVCRDAPLQQEARYSADINQLLALCAKGSDDLPSNRSRSEEDRLARFLTENNNLSILMNQLADVQLHLYPTLQAQIIDDCAGSRTLTETQNLLMLIRVVELSANFVQI